MRTVYAADTQQLRRAMRDLEIIHLLHRESATMRPFTQDTPQVRTVWAKEEYL